MENTIILMSILSVVFILMHEFEAFYREEWKMMKFLRKFKEETQYQIFLYAHIPLTLFIFYFMYTVVSFSNIILWIIVNVFMILHFLLHLIARKWESNVFKSINSFVFIGGAAITGFINLCLITNY